MIARARSASRGPAAAVALLLLFGTVASGCTKAEDSAASGGGVGQQSASTKLPLGNADRGKEVFRANCSRCHGAVGTEGGVGPSLAGEKTRKNYAQLLAWIQAPLPPMPVLYPTPLTERDLHDVAAYVEHL